MTIALGVDGDGRRPTRMIGQHGRAAREPAVPARGEMDAYERVLGDAMAGDRTLFAREDYVEEAWRIVDPVLKAGTPVFEYEPGTWGPEGSRSHRGSRRSAGRIRGSRVELR